MMKNYLSRGGVGFKFLLVFLFFSHFLFAESPSIFIVSPVENMITSKDQVLFKGRVQDIHSLSLNGKAIMFDDEGKFFFRQSLIKPNEYHEFIFNGKGHDGRDVSVTRKVYYKVDEQTLKGELVVLSPKDNTITSKKQILFKGRVQGLQSLTFNGKPVVFDSEGFFFKQSLTKPNEYHYFVFKGKTLQGADINVKRSVYWSQPLDDGDKSRSESGLTVLSPENNKITSKSQVLFKGRVQGIQSLTLDGEPVSFDEEGNFFFKRILTQPNTYHHFVFKGQTQDGKNIELTRKVYYKAGQEDSKQVSKSQESELIVLLSPMDNTITSKSQILFKGKAQGIKSLTLDGEPVSFDEKGNFFFKRFLTQPNTYHHFVFKGETRDGKNISLKRKVYYKFHQEEIRSNLSILTPADNTITSKDKILFKGRVEEDIESLTLDGKEIIFDDKGKFFFRKSLTIPNKYHHFVFKGKTFDGEAFEVTRKVYYKVAQEVKQEDANLVIISPEDNTITSKSKFLFKGSTEKIKSLSINGELVDIDQDGRFFHKIPLSRFNQYEHFVIVARTLDGQSILKKRKVFYKQDFQEKVAAISPPEMKQESDVKQKRWGRKNKKKSDSQPPESELQIQNVPIPLVYVKYPQNNYVTYRSSIKLKGRVDYAKELYINSRIVKLDKNNNFSEEFELPEVGKYIFNFYALGNKDLNTSHIHKIFRLSENESDKTKTDTEDFAVFKKLNRKVSLDLSQADIKYVLGVLSKKGDLNIISDKSLSGVVNVSLNNVTLETAIDLILTSQGLSYRVVDNTIVVGSPSKLNSASHIENQIFRLDNINVQSVETVLKQYLSAGEYIQVLENENMIVVKADSKKIKEFRRLVKQLDAHRVPQIILEAQILEISESSLDDLGVAWNNTYGFGASGTITDGQTSYTGGLSLETVITLLENEGKARILAKPRIKAIDREEAEIFIGDELPYIELATDPSGRVQESVKYVDSGIHLRVKPFININTQEIRIEIEPEVSYVNGFKGSNNDIPIVRKRRVNTTVFVKNGQTVLIGGLFNSSDTDSMNRFPLLSRVPILGIFFKNNKRTNDQTELVIAITPQIVDVDLEEAIPKLLVTDSGDF